MVWYPRCENAPTSRPFHRAPLSCPASLWRRDKRKVSLPRVRASPFRTLAGGPVAAIIARSSDLAPRFSQCCRSSNTPLCADSGREGERGGGEGGASPRIPGAAAEEGDERIVRLLLERRANVSLAASDGGTPLHRASLFGHDLCARALLEAGSDPNKANNEGVTALIKAAENGHDQCARALLEAGSDPNKAKSNGGTALMLAAQHGHDLCARAIRFEFWYL